MSINLRRALGLVDPSDIPTFVAKMQYHLPLPPWYSQYFHPLPYKVANSLTPRIDLTDSEEEISVFSEQQIQQYADLSSDECYPGASSKPFESTPHIEPSQLRGQYTNQQGGSLSTPTDPTMTSLQIFSTVDEAELFENTRTKDATQWQSTAAPLFPNYTHPVRGSPTAPLNSQSKPHVKPPLPPTPLLRPPPPSTPPPPLPPPPPNPPAL
jgi:hypothetical protein